MDLSYSSGTFADARGHTLCRPRAYVSDRENTRTACLQRSSWADSGRNEAFIVERDATVEPLSVRIGPDEQKQVLRIDEEDGATIAASHFDALQ
jgi:hypothetical protein